MKLLQWLSLAVAALGIVLVLAGSLGMSDTPYCSNAPMPVGSVCRDTDGSGKVIRERSYEQVRQTAANLRMIAILTGVGVIGVGVVGSIIAVTRGRKPPQSRHQGPGPQRPPALHPQQHLPMHQPPGVGPGQPGWNAGPPATPPQQPWANKPEDGTRIVPRDWPR